MSKTKYMYVPFGSNVNRFGKITVHPNLDPNGLYTKRPSGCDPGLYHPKLIHEIFVVNKNREVKKDVWRYKSELEDWSKNLGYRNQKILNERRWYNTILGPAWYELLDTPINMSVCENLGFGRTRRFQVPRNDLPGPGNYYKINQFRNKQRSIPTFEREEPCRFKDMSPAWSLAPGRYKIIDKNSIEQKSNKITSLRGPYDLFTGKRDGAIRNHFNVSLKCTAATWPIALKGTLNEYSNSHFGEMNKTGRNIPYRGRNVLTDLSMCLKKARDPGPAHYNLNKEKTFKQNKWGFDSSYDKPPGYKRVIVWPGVGRYKIKDISCGITGQGHRHVFLGKQKRTIGAILPEAMNTF